MDLNLPESSELPCADKLKFNNREEAEASAAVAEYQHGSSLKPYVCRDCGLWHLASK